ncbi:MAG TPA: Calx-beta domain-containing protein [Fibrobacteria bacterium]|nr:Calx-beta domain-containing protein [Fibrobacteria bacterium]
MKLRAPYVGAGHNLSIGPNVSDSFNLPKTDVGNNLYLGSSTLSDSLIQVGDTLSFGGQPIVLSGASTSAGTFANMVAGDAVTNQIHTSNMGPPLQVANTSLPGYTIAGYAPPTTPPNLDLSGPATTTNPVATFLSPTSTTAYYWNCSTAGLPAGSCHGDTLLPGYYGDLNVTGNQQAILLTEGFYSFTSIELSGGNAIIAAQPTGGRTVVYASGNVTASSSHAFIGPDGGRLATAFGSGPGQFLGGTMMLASGGNIVIPSDNRIWATISAPKGDVHLSSQVTLFGQLFAKRLFGDNNIDFGAGAFIPFRGLVPTLIGLTNFTVKSKTDTSCHDATGKPCRDTTLTVSMPNTTAYPVIFEWFTVAMPAGIGHAGPGLNFKVDSGWDTIQPQGLTAPVTVRIYNDSSYAPPESLWVVLTNATAAGFANKSGVLDTTLRADTVVGVIVNDNQPPLIRIQRASPRDSFPEGNSVTRPEAFTVTLLDPVTGLPLTSRLAPQLPVLFEWGTSDGTATVANNDYLPVSGRWDTIAANAVSTTVSVQVVGDTVYEPDEWFLVHIDSLVHAIKTSANGHRSLLSDTGWITNDDVPPVWISGDTVQQPASGFVNARFPVHLAGPSKVATSFVWRTAPGTAVPGLNYTAVDSTVVVLPPGTTDTALVVRVLADSLAGEGVQTFQVVLSHLSGLTFGNGNATGTILPAHGSLSLALDSVGRVVESDTTVHFHLSLDWYPADTVRVVFHTVSLGAHPGEQYRDTTGVLLFLPGQRLDSIPVSIFQDTVWEPDLSFELRLDSVVSRIPLVTDSVGLATLTDGGPIPTVQFTTRDTALYEHKAGTVQVQVALSRPSGVALSTLIPVLPASTAALGTNFTFSKLAGDTLTFPARSETGLFAVVVIPNGVLGPDREVVLGLSPFAPLGKGADSVWTLTIIDDNAIPNVKITSPRDSLRTRQIVQNICYTVDGVAQPCKDSTLTPGWDTITRCSTNQFGNTGCDTVHVWVDTTPPVLQVFKIMGPNTHNPALDTTWWGKTARTRFGVDTVWYWVRDSIENPDHTWRVLVDTFSIPTNFKGDGLYPVPARYCDSVGNCAEDTGWISLKQSLPIVDIVTPPEGAVVQIGEIGVIWTVDNAGPHLQLQDTHDVTTPGVDTVTRCYTDDVGNTGCDTHHILANPIQALSGYYLDTNGDGRIDALVVNLSSPWTLPLLPSFTAPLDSAVRTGQSPDSARPFYKRPGAVLVDSTRLLVPIDPPFAYGVTGFPVQTGIMQEIWSSGLGNVVFKDSFPIYDSVPPVIRSATIHRVENYTDPDTLVVVPSEPLDLSKAKDWLQVGICKNDSATCPDSLLAWHTVPADSVHAMGDSAWWFLVPPGQPGSVSPGYKLRFLAGVTDSLGNQVDTANLHWATVVQGPPRPPLLQVSEPGKIPYIPSSEQNRSGPGGILLQATDGSENADSTNLQWWDPNRGYLTSSDPQVQAVCPDDGNYCNGPSLYLNYPVRMILYIYDHEGVFVISKTVDITQANLDALKGDKIGRVRISLRWNHRTIAGQVVASGVYHWRVISYVHIPGNPVPVMDNELFNLGVKVQ